MTPERVKKNQERERKHLVASLSGYDLWFDIDGTLALAADPILRKFNQDHNTKLTIADITHFWVLSKHLRLLYPDMNEKTARHIEYWNYWANEELLSQAPVIPGARRLLSTLSEIKDEAGLELNIITAREPHLSKCTYEWLGTHGFYQYVDEDHVFVRQDDSVPGNAFKASNVRGGIVVEDSIYAVKSILDGDNQGTWVVWLPYIHELGEYNHERLVIVKEMATERDLKHVYQALLDNDFNR